MTPGIKICAAAINLTPLDWDGNTEKILSAIEIARSWKAQILCLPELCISGYGCEDMFFAPWVHARAAEQLAKILPHTKGIAVAVGLPFQFESKIYNGTALLADGALLGITAKKNLADDGVHYEQRWFTAWPVGKRATLSFNGENIPAGDLVYDFGSTRIGFEICEDAWVSPRHGCDLAARGTTLILNTSASHFGFGKRDTVIQLVKSATTEFNCSYVYTNVLGCESGRTIFGGDALIASGGELLASAPRFAFEDVSAVSAVIPSPSKALPPSLHSVTSQLRFSETQTPSGQQPGLSWDTSTTANRAAEGEQILRFEEFTRAVALGLFDYMRKSYSHGFTLSLSGGADSAAIACLVLYMRNLVHAELSKEQLAAKLKYAPELAEAIWSGSILSCAYQGTKNSSQVTRTAAAEVAKAVSAKFFDFAIDAIVEQYKAVVSKAIGRNLSWEKDDIALQNIQARTRSPSIWLLANINKSLLLTTANRSEASVGYATMDGDTSGGLAPLGGIDKHFLRQWLRWVEKVGPLGLNNIPAIRFINEQEPTAELRPLEANQTDEKDLMPYEILEALERSFIKEKLSPSEILPQIIERFAMRYSASDIAQWCNRFWSLWRANQWKRERYAPAFHIDTFSVDPKSWCRYPILSGKI